MVDCYLTPNMVIGQPFFKQRKFHSKACIPSNMLSYAQGKSRFLGSLGAPPPFIYAFMVIPCKIHMQLDCPLANAYHHLECSGYRGASKAKKRSRCLFGRKKPTLNWPPKGRFTLWTMKSSHVKGLFCVGRLHGTTSMVRLTKILVFMVHGPFTRCKPNVDHEE
jgi:hypothetical protein